MSPLHLPHISTRSPPYLSYTLPNRKVYPIWPALTDLWFETGTDADLGTFVTGEDGLLRCAKRAMASDDPRWAERLAS